VQVQQIVTNLVPPSLLQTGRTRQGTHLASLGFQLLTGLLLKQLPLQHEGSSLQQTWV
jgi:hypothetical protein